MTTGQRAALALALVFASVALAPPSSAHHCESGLRAYARDSFTLAPPAPPHATNAPTICSATRSIVGHELPSTADQVLVRCYCPFQPGIASLLVSLDGLGFQDQLFRLHRVDRPTEAFYEFPAWVYFPDGASAEGELTVTLIEPSYHKAVVRYTKGASPLP